MIKADYKNKNILVIGGSFGIGKELFCQLAAAGANLALAARSLQEITELTKEVRGNHLAISCDVLDKKSLDNLCGLLCEKWTKIDIVIFCVGTYKPMNLDNFDLQAAEDISAVNYNGFLNFIAAFLTCFKQKKIGQMAVISSVAGYFGMPNSLAYGASKAALTNLCESLYYELRRYEVKVQLISPGFVKTRLTDQNKFSMPGIISPEIAAKNIISNLSKSKFEIRTPLMFTLVMKILQLLPYRIRFFLFRNVK